jgi:hypothetical protein
VDDGGAGAQRESNTGGRVIQMSLHGVAETYPRRNAQLSVCGTYRYQLFRSVKPYGRAAAFVGVNPSTADGHTDDQTIRKLYGFGETLDIAHWLVGNKFSYRSTDVSALAIADDPIGPANDDHLEEIFRLSEIVIVGWGSLAKLPRPLRDRWRDVAALAARVGRSLHCWGTARDGHPLHPLMLDYQRTLVRWTPPA